MFANNIECRKIKLSNKPLLVWIENERYRSFDGENYLDIGGNYFAKYTVRAIEGECKEILEIFNKK